jgi:hypothetical protein
VEVSIANNACSSQARRDSGSKKNRSLSQVSVEDANKKKRMVDFAAVAWLKRIGSKMLLSVIGTYIYRYEEVDERPMTRAL